MLLLKLAILLLSSTLVVPVHQRRKAHDASEVAVSETMALGFSREFADVLESEKILAVFQGLAPPRDNQQFAEFIRPVRDRTAISNVFPTGRIVDITYFGDPEKVWRKLLATKEAKDGLPLDEPRASGYKSIRFTNAEIRVYPSIIRYPGGMLGNSLAPNLSYDLRSWAQTPTGGADWLDAKWDAVDRQFQVDFINYDKPAFQTNECRDLSPSEMAKLLVRIGLPGQFSSLLSAERIIATTRPAPIEGVPGGRSIIISYFGNADKIRLGMLRALPQMAGWTTARRSRHFGPSSEGHAPSELVFQDSHHWVTVYTNEELIDPWDIGCPVDGSRTYASRVDEVFDRYGDKSGFYEIAQIHVVLKERGGPER